MIKKNRHIFKSVLIIILSVFVFTACNHHEGSSFPKNGEFCYKSSSATNPEYIHINFLDNKVDGTLYMENEVEGNVFYRFSGRIINDSILQLDVHVTANEPTNEKQEWIIYWKNNDIRLKNSLGRNQTIAYEMMSCAPFYQIVDTLTYASVEQVENDREAERWENEFKVVCFEPLASLTDSGTKIPSHEYIRLGNDRGRIYGWGYGGSGEELQWTFDFTGVLADDSTLNVKVNYTMKGKPESTVSETWYINGGRTNLRLGENTATHPGAKAYRTTKCPNEFYFASTSPNAMKRTPLFEYIKLSYQDKMVWGTGSGDFTQGSEPWTLFFRGTFTDGDNIKLNVSYLQEGKIISATDEVWTIDLDKKRLYRKGWTASKNQMGAEEYAMMESYEIPKEFFERIGEINPKTLNQK